MNYNGRRFEDKIVLVTGGNSGIGLTTAERFAAEGAQVIITGRNEETLREAAQKIGSQATAIVADVGRLNDLDNLYRQIAEKFGRLDAIFVNAGVASLYPLAETTEEIYDSLMEINVKGAFFTMQKAIPLLANPSAMVINSSIAGVIGQLPNSPASFGVYAASKAAVRSLARTFSAELIGRGVRVNVVSPGAIETPLWTRTAGVPAEFVPAIKEQLASTIPMKRVGTSEEVAAAVAFLCSNEASYIVGTELFIDGGVTQL